MTSKRSVFLWVALSASRSKLRKQGAAIDSGVSALLVQHGLAYDALHINLSGSQNYSPRLEAKLKKVQTVVVFRTHVTDLLTVRLGRALFASSGRLGARSVLVYDSDALLGDNLTAIFGVKHAIGIGVRSMLERYPLVEPRKAIIKSHYQQLAYALALHSVGEYDFAWCVEHDAGVPGGDWADVFRAHAADRRDLLAWRVGWTPKLDAIHGGGTWNSRMIFGSLRATPLADIGFLFGPIIRYSRQFVELLDSSALAGTYGHFETAVPTLCNRTAWCTMGNISDEVVGLLDYQLPVAITSSIFEAFKLLLPNKIFHPVRETKSASSARNVLVSNVASRRPPDGLLSKPYLSRSDRRHAMIVAQCLLRNPRPLRPSFSCPVGCPHYMQQTCPIVNCMWGQSPHHRYVHLAVAKCIALCKQHPAGCPYDTAVDIRP